MQAPSDLHSSQPQPRFARLLPVLLFIIAAVPRFVGLRWGLPSAAHWYSYHPDESTHQILGAVLSMILQGGFNPHFFNYPSLYIYLTYGGYTVASGLGLMHPLPNNAADLWTIMYDVLLVGRVLTVLLGAATVSLVYLIGRDISRRRTGLVAALFLAFLPGCVQHSHFATVDIPATFFITLVLWLTVRALQLVQASEPNAIALAAQRQKRFLLLAAGVAGLAAATKYNAGLVLIAPLLALYLQHQRDFWKLSVPLCSVAALGFLIGCPYSILSLREFWGEGQNGLAFEILTHPRIGSGEVFQGTGNGWWYHLTFNLPFVMTWPLLLVALGGIVLITRSMRRPAPQDSRSKAEQAALLVLLAWTALYFLALGFSQVRFMRYTLPLMPTFCLFAALGLQQIDTLIQGKRQATKDYGLWTMCGSLLLIALIGTTNILFPFIMPDPRDQAAQFLAAQTPTSTTVGLLTPPWFWTPPLTPQNAARHDTVSEAELAQLSALSRGRYRFVITGFKASALAEAKPRWFVMNEIEWRDQARLQDAHYESFRALLNRDYSLKASFKNSPPLALPGRAFVPHDFLYTNPEIEVYRRR